MHTFCRLCGTHVGPGRSRCPNPFCERPSVRDAWLGAAILLLGIIGWCAVAVYLAPSNAWDILEPQPSVAAPR